MPRDGFNFHSRWAILQQMVDFAADGHFRSPFCSCEMRVKGCEMALVCQGGVLQLQNFSQRGVWGCEIISQPRAIFAGALFGLRNFADHGFFLAFELLLIPRDILSISLQFLLN